LKSSSFSPSARSRDLWGALSTPSLTLTLGMFQLAAYCIKRFLCFGGDGRLDLAFRESICCS
ncbi:MAG: hypothetical protein JRM72_09205, partial [Nitrososphaerota archaeon]|nr:hypothetical protein [Nitrososphaerota archaeon]